MGREDESDGGKQGMTREGEFIPGLPNDIVLHYIATKISLGEMYALTCVNREWRNAIRSREIYRLRKEKGATQSMVVAYVASGVYKGFMDVDTQEFYFFAAPGFLKSRFDKTPGSRQDWNKWFRKDFCSNEFTRNEMTSDEVQWDNFPSDDVTYPIPFRGCTSDDDIFAAEGIVSLGGKLYALRHNGSGVQDVQVLDVGACEVEWKPCSGNKSDKRAKIWVACNGKIYWFCTRQSRIHGWAFDPKNTKWTEIEDRPLNVCHGRHRARSRNLHMNRSYLRRKHCGMAVLENEIYLGSTYGTQMMVFDSVTEKWRTIPSTLLDDLERLTVTFNCFEMAVIKDNLYSFTRLGVEGYTGNTESRSWTVLQPTFSQEFNNRFPDVTTVAAWGNEIVALLALDDSAQFQDGSSKKFCKSNGFGVKGGTLIWEIVPEFCLKKCLSGASELVLDHVEV